MSTISPEEYEAAILELFDRQFLPLGHRVEGTRNNKKFKHPGAFSETARQCDAAVFRPGESKPYLIGEAHRYGKPLDVKDVETFLGMMLDLEAKMGVLVCPNGYSDAAKKRARSSDLQCHVVTIEEAHELNLLAEARTIYPWDWAFHDELAQAIRSLRKDEGSEIFAEALEGVPYEEWTNLVQYALSRHPQEARKVLLEIARNHQGDGWRFNAIQNLSEQGFLVDEEILSFAEREINGENRELLLENLSDSARDLLVQTASTHSDAAWRYNLVDFLGRHSMLSKVDITRLRANEKEPAILDVLDDLLDEVSPD